MKKHLHLSVSLLGILLLFNVLSSCKTTQFNAQIQVKSLKANDLEESISGQDELMLAYTLTAYDEHDKSATTLTGVWGVEKVKKNQVFESVAFKPIQLDIPPKGRLVASLILIEVEDYNKTQKLIDDIRKANSIAGIPSVILEAGESFTPLRYLTYAIMAAGLSVKGMKYFDADDILGEHMFELKASDVAKGKRLYGVPVTFKDKNLLDTYHYELVYDLALKSIRLR